SPWRPHFDRHGSARSPPNTGPVRKRGGALGETHARFRADPDPPRAPARKRSTLMPRRKRGSASIHVLHIDRFAGDPLRQGSGDEVVDFAVEDVVGAAGSHTG